MCVTVGLRVKSSRQVDQTASVCTRDTRDGQKTLDKQRDSSHETRHESLMTVAT